MSMSFEEIKSQTENHIGEGRSKHIFGSRWKILYQVIIEEETELNQDKLGDALSKCEFKDPERIGLISLICPILCFDISDRVLSKAKGLAEIYKFCIGLGYITFIAELLDCIIKQKTDPLLYLVFGSAIVTSIVFRLWARDWNMLEFLYNIDTKRSGRQK